MITGDVVNLRTITSRRRIGPGDQQRRRSGPSLTQLDGGDHS